MFWMKRNCQSCHYSWFFEIIIRIILIVQKVCFNSCNGDYESNCLICDSASFRLLISNSSGNFCVCDEGYLDVPNNNICFECEVDHCKTCETLISECDECKN